MTSDLMGLRDAVRRLVAWGLVRTPTTEYEWRRQAESLRRATLRLRCSVCGKPAPHRLPAGAPTSKAVAGMDCALVRPGGCSGVFEAVLPAQRVGSAVLISGSDLGRFAARAKSVGGRPSGARPAVALAEVAILEALKAGPKTTVELGVTAATSRQTLLRALRELEGRGAIQRRETGRTGRISHTWEIGPRIEPHGAPVSGTLEP